MSDNESNEPSIAKPGTDPNHHHDIMTTSAASASAPTLRTSKSVDLGDQNELDYEDDDENNEVTNQQPRIFILSLHSSLNCDYRKESNRIRRRRPHQWVVRPPLTTTTMAN